ncbi:hypothetical protein [Legionella sp. CNM-4043-24]|uniref:hypothetical protein n=1 Tax=Legionella sp. CNM-4043-24 TaxID=3421646 RepID=UPI00403A8DC7
MFEEDEKSEKKYTTACEIYFRMLSEAPVVREEEIAGGPGLGVSTDGQVILSRQERSVRTSYDKDTNDLLRARFACQEDMFVSPLSTQNQTFFAKKETLKRHEEIAEQRMRKLEEQRAQEPQEQERRCSIQ